MKWIYRIAIGLVGTVVLAIGALAVVVSYSASCGDAPQYDGDDGMRAVTARCYGSPDVLAVERLPIPEVGSGPRRLGQPARLALHARFPLHHAAAGRHRQAE